jgi:YD repeat-containing protein
MRLSPLSFPFIFPGNVTTYTYNALGRVLTKTLPAADANSAAPVYHYAYDDAGNLISTTDALGNVTLYVYDNLGRLIEQIDPNPDTGAASQTDADCPKTYYTYDLVGNLLTVTDPLGHTTSYTYDGQNNLLTATDAEGTTSYTHDLVGDVLTQTDAEGNVTSWTYDGLGRVTSETDALDHTIQYEYDLNGNLTEKIDRDGRATVYTYDKLGRETHEYWYADSNLTTAEERFTYTYDAVGNMLTATEQTLVGQSYVNVSSYTYVYDPVGEVTYIEADLTGLTSVILHLTYDANGNVTDVTANIGGTLTSSDANHDDIPEWSISGTTVSDFRNHYTYDNLGQLTGITQQANGSNLVAAKYIALAYDADGQLDTITRYADTAATQQVAVGTYTYLCPCQLAGAEFWAGDGGTEKRVGGAGGEDSSPCPAARGGRKVRQDAGAAMRLAIAA